MKIFYQSQSESTINNLRSSVDGLLTTPSVDWSADDCAELQGIVFPGVSMSPQAGQSTVRLLMLFSFPSSSIIVRR